MSAIKQSMIIISLFILLFAIVLIPMAYIEYQNENILIELFISPVKTIQLNAQTEKADAYNIWERIRIKSKSVVVSSSVPTELRAELLRRMEDQIALISTYRAIPDISLSGVIQVSLTKETYIDKPSDISSRNEHIDSINTDQVLSVWEIIVEYQNYVVCAYMDTVTDAIYDITIVTKESDFIFQSEVTDTGFLEYLGTFSDIPTDSKVTFSAGSYYSGGKICLYLYSVGKDSQVSIYRFNHTQISDAYPLYKYDEYGNGKLYSISDADVE